MRSCVLAFTTNAPCSNGSTSSRSSLPRMSFILIDRPHPGVALVTLNRPERMNAMAFDVMIPLREALESLSLDNDVRVVVLTGAGHGFCSGADLEDSGIVPNIDGLTVTSIARRALELLDDVVHAIRK